MSKMFLNKVARDDEILVKKRTKFFKAFAFISFALNVTLLILIPITMAKAVFLQIINRSNFVEIANVFRDIDLTLRGNCITFIGNSQLCTKLSLPEMFFRFPDFSRVPLKVNPEDLPSLFSQIPGQNPAIFIPLLVMQLVVVLSIVFIVRAYTMTTKRRILSSAIVSGTAFILSVVCLAISDKIYGDILPKLLNQPITVSVTKDGTLQELTGRPTAVGIRFVYGQDKADGRASLMTILIISLVTFLMGIRWFFEGTRPERIRNRIRVADTDV